MLSAFAKAAANSLRTIPDASRKHPRRAGRPNGDRERGRVNANVREIVDRSGHRRGAHRGKFPNDGAIDAMTTCT